MTWLLGRIPPSREGHGGRVKNGESGLCTPVIRLLFLRFPVPTAQIRVHPGQQKGLWVSGAQLEGTGIRSQASVTELKAFLATLSPNYQRIAPLRDFIDLLERPKYLSVKYLVIQYNSTLKEPFAKEVEDLDQ